MSRIELLLDTPKWELVAYARRVQAALPGHGVIVSGRKADIAYSIASALARHEEEGRAPFQAEGSVTATVLV